MKRLVLHGATLGCTHGTAPSSLSVNPSRSVDAGGAPVATVHDHAPLLNIAPFGMCRSLSNPRVAAATAAAQGALTPQMCVPHTPSPWTQPEGAPTLDDVEALHEGASCGCAWGGRIEVRDTPGGPTLR